MTSKMPIKAEPFKHQKEAFDFAMSHADQHGIALLMSMGCGKSLTAIAAAGALYNAKNIKKALIVCPLSIVGVWKEEFSKFADFDYKLVILKGNTAKKTELLQKMQGPGLQVVVVNYESVWRMEDKILSWSPDFIIADESHRIKAPNTAASKAMHRFGTKAKYRMILTGTVITNKAIDVFSQYKFVDPTIFGNSFYAFRNKYFDMVGYGGYTPVLKESMKDELMKKLHSIAFRATKADCLDLPPTTDIIRYTELEPKAMNIYQSLVKDSFAQLSNCEITVTNVLTKLLRLSQLTGGFLGSDGCNIYQQVSKSKLEVLEDIIDEAVQSGEKLVVIARFIPEIKAIEKLRLSKTVKS